MRIQNVLCFVLHKVFFVCMLLPHSLEAHHPPGKLNLKTPGCHKHECPLAVNGHWCHIFVNKNNNKRLKNSLLLFFSFFFITTPSFISWQYVGLCGFYTGIKSRTAVLTHWAFVSWIVLFLNVSVMRLSLCPHWSPGCLWPVFGSNEKTSGAA